MVLVLDNSYRNYRTDQRERANDFFGWKVADKFGRPMGTLGEYIAKQNPKVTNNSQYEDSFGEFTLNDPPSGEELYATLTCYLYGLATGYFRRYPTKQVFDWKVQTKVTLLNEDNNEIKFCDLVGKNQDRFQLAHMSLSVRVAISK